MKKCFREMIKEGKGWEKESKWERNEERRKGRNKILNIKAFRNLRWGLESFFEDIEGNG